MAQITKRKNGSYLIRVSCGYSADGKKQITQSMTWKPPRDNMTDKQTERALNKAAADFEAACAGGRIVNARKLQAFIEDWFTVHETALTASTIKKYRTLCPRIFERLGHLRIDRVKTADIDRFLIWLADERLATPLGKCRKDLEALIKATGETQKAFAARAGVSANCVRSCYGGGRIVWNSAVKISEALGKKPEALFDRITDESKLSAKTVRGYHGFLSTVFSYAVKIGEIAVNPCTNCTLPKVSAPEHKILTIEQTQQLLQLLDEHAPLKYRAFFNLAIYGGFRLGEILGLTWKDIDFETGVVQINRSAHWSKAKGYYYTDPKTAQSKRAVRVSDRVILILRQLKNEQLSAALQYGDYWSNKQGLLFTTDSGSQMSMSTPYSFFSKFCDQYGLPRVSIHSLRHLNATLLINSGANPKTVQALLGHSTAVTTMSIYAHEIQSAEAAASAALAAMLDGQLDTEAKQA